MSRKLTKAGIDRALAEAPDGSERFLFDSLVPGLALRVRDGRGSYVFQFRVRGRSKRLKLGDAVARDASASDRAALTLDQARDLARPMYATVRAGGDPSEQRREARARRATVADAATAYLADLDQRAQLGAKRGRRSSAAEFRRVAEKLIVPALGRVEVENLDEERVARWHREFVGRPSAGNRALGVLRTILEFAGRKRIVPRGLPNPTAGVARFEERKRRERFTLADLAKLGEALRAAEAEGKVLPSVALALRVLAASGLRRSELLGHPSTKRRTDGDVARWGDFDADAGTLTLRRTKAGGGRVVVLGAPLAEILRQARPADATPDAPICPGQAQRDRSAPRAGLVGLDRAAARLCAAAGVTWPGAHSLRRLFATVAGEQGHGPYIVAELLGHRVTGGGAVTGLYVRPQFDPLRQAADRIAVEVLAALDGKGAAVLSFRNAEGVR